MKKLVTILLAIIVLLFSYLIFVGSTLPRKPWIVVSKEPYNGLSVERDGLWRYYYAMPNRLIQGQFTDTSFAFNVGDTIQ